MGRRKQQIKKSLSIELVRNIAADFHQICEGQTVGGAHALLRIVNLESSEIDWSAQLAVNMFVKYLAKRLEGTNENI